MYDELINRMREFASLPEHCENVADCDQCPKEDICIIYANKQVFEVLSQAADAVEELRRSEAVALEYGVGEHNRRLALEQKHRWIPVTERMPEKSGHYLVNINCKCGGERMSAWMQVAWFCKKFYWEHLHSDEIFKENVTHWMPLPEPPKEDPHAES